MEITGLPVKIEIDSAVANALTATRRGKVSPGVDLAKTDLTVVAWVGNDLAIFFDCADQRSLITDCATPGTVELPDGEAFYVSAGRARFDVSGQYAQYILRVLATNETATFA